MKTALYKPRIESVPLAAGLRWRAGNSSGFLYQEKSDGRHEFADIAGAVVNAERMASGDLVVNDLVSIDGQDLRREPMRIRWAELVRWSAFFARGTRLCRTGPGGEFLEYLLRDGGEGVVAKPLAAPFGVNWHKCKRCQAFQVVIIALDHARGSVALADPRTMQPRGRLSLRGGKFERVRLGSVLKVEVYGLAARGLFREARLDHDGPGSWLVSI